MTGRELISYISNNCLESAEVNGIEELSFEIPVRNVFVYHEDNTEDTLDYRPYSGSIYHLYDDGRTAEFIDIKEAFAIRGIDYDEWIGWQVFGHEMKDTAPTYENISATGGWSSGRYPWGEVKEES